MLSTCISIKKRFIELHAKLTLDARPLSLRTFAWPPARQDHAIPTARVHLFPWPSGTSSAAQPKNRHQVLVYDASVLRRLSFLVVSVVPTPSIAELIPTPRHSKVARLLEAVVYRERQESQYVSPVYRQRVYYRNGSRQFSNNTRIFLQRTS